MVEIACVVSVVVNAVLLVTMVKYQDEQNKILREHIRNACTATYDASAEFTRRSILLLAKEVRRD